MIEATPETRIQTQATRIGPQTPGTEARHPVSTRGMALACLVVASVALAALLPGCASGPPAPDLLAVEYDPSLEIDLGAMERRSSGLLVRDVISGTGAAADRGSEVQIHYIGAFPDGTVFDSSVSRGEPLRFRLGESEVIRAWEEGIPGMRVGGQRTLIVPARLGYGSRGLGDHIPGDQILVFEIQLLQTR